MKDTLILSAIAGVLAGIAFVAILQHQHNPCEHGPQFTPASGYGTRVSGYYYVQLDGERGVWSKQPATPVPNTEYWKELDQCYWKDQNLSR